MKLIFISGPSGSGKTTLSNQILVKILNGIVLSTDNYYKTGIRSKILSNILEGYFDRRISFNINLLKKDLNFIINNRLSNYKRYYDFNKKHIKKILFKTNNINYVILEGIFAKELLNNLNNHECFFLELKINKKTCMNRAIKRDLLERGKYRKKAIKDFLKSWDIYYNRIKNKKNKKNKNFFLITKNTNIDEVLKKIFSLNY